MKYTTIFEKILCIFNLISDSWLNIAFVGITTLLIILLGFKKLSKRTCFIFITVACFSLFGYTIYTHFEPLSQMMNSLIDNLFMNIYFPSTYAYLFILVVTDVVAIISLLNPRGEKIYKTIHGICFIMINFVLTIILEMIAKNSTDIFSKESLFANTDLITLLEFSMNLFILWLVSLFVVYFINMITERIVIAKENNVLETAPANICIEETSLSEKQLTEEYQKESIKDEERNELEPSVLEPVAFVPDTTQKHFMPNFESTENSTSVEPTIVATPYAYSYPTNQDVTLTNDFKALESLNPFNTLSTIIPPMKEQSIAPVQERKNVQANNHYANNPYNNMDFTNTFDLSSFIPKKQEIKPIQTLNQTTNANEILDQILKNELPIMKDEPAVPVSVTALEKEAHMAEKNTYTLNDYRIFGKMLEDIRELNQSNSIQIDKNQIDKNLEYRLITKYSNETYDMFKKMLELEIFLINKKEG